MRLNSEVWWLYTEPRGWNWTSRVWARVVGFTDKRVKIAVQMRNGSTEEKTVTADKLISCEDYYRRAFNDLIAWG